MTRAEHLIKREARLRDGRTIWEPLWRNLGQFILPRKTNVLLGRQGGEKQTQKLFDSTAIHANEVLTASIHGALTNPIIRWFSLRMREKALNEVQEISLWLEDCSERIFLALQNSNFSTQINEVYLDLGAFGTAAILAEEKAISHGGFNGFVFRALTIGEYVIAEDAEGVVDTIFRRFTFPARVVVKKWPTASDVVKKLAERDSETPVTILHAVFPREDAKGGLRASRGKPFASFFVEVDTKTLLSEGGYDEFPYMVPRWATASSEIYGRGPGFTALPDTMTLNRAKEFDLKSWAKKLDPPIQSLDDGVLSGVSKFAHLVLPNES